MLDSIICDHIIRDEYIHVINDLYKVMLLFFFFQRASVREKLAIFEENLYFIFKERVPFLFQSAGNYALTFYVYIPLSEIVYLHF